MVHLRKRLAAYIRRKRNGIPQRVFARKTGVAQSTIMRIENEDQNVTLDTLEQLCKAFNVDVGDLFPAQPLPRTYRQAQDTAKVQPPMIHDEARSQQGGKDEVAGAEAAEVKVVAAKSRPKRRT